MCLESSFPLDFFKCNLLLTPGHRGCITVFSNISYYQNDVLSVPREKLESTHNIDAALELEHLPIVAP
jgi:hypothetical protein